MVRKRMLWLGVFLAVFLVSCSGLVASPTPTTAPSPTPTAGVLPTPTPMETSTPQPDRLTLTIWVPEFLGAPGAEQGISSLESSIARFEDFRRGVTVEVIVKKDSGDGGLYQLLSTAHDAAPAILPDLIILNQTDLPIAVAEAYLQPMKPAYLPQSDFYSFTLEGLEQDGGLSAIPLLTTANHFAYKPGLSSSPPVSWTSVLTEGYSLLFPGDPVGGIADDALLTLYLGAGGRIQDDEGRAVLERADLEELYRFIESLLDSGLLEARQALSLADASDCYGLFETSSAALSPVPSDLYWSESVSGSLPIWAPSVSGAAIALGRTWSVAMVTSSPLRQPAALQLALWLVSSESEAALSEDTGMFPSRRSAVRALSGTPYDQQFLEALLTGAVKAPAQQVDLAVRRALQAGLTILLTEPATTPEEAAAYALTSLRQ